MKQTAIEWLYEQLDEKLQEWNFIKEVFEEAKEMEKEQIIDAWDNGIQCEWGSDIRNSEQYYNTTFKSK